MHRSGLNIMAKLFFLIDSLTYVIILAILNGSLGYITAISITLFGALGVAKLLGASIIFSWISIYVMIICFGITRGILRYIEQYSNHYIAFKILAILRDKIFTKLRELCPAKLESKQKGSIISMITSDIETLEVFFAHTISPIGIAVLVSLFMILFIGFVVNWYMALFALFAYMLIGIIYPIISNKILRQIGIEYRNEFSYFNGFFMDAIKGNKSIILHNRKEKFQNKIDLHSDKLLISTTKLKNRISLSEAITSITIVILNFTMLIIGIVLVKAGKIEAPIMLIGVIALMSSYGPVLALNALPNNLNQTFASGDRILDLLEEKPVIQDIKNGTNFDFKSLKINNLTFSYNDDMNIIKNINMNVRKGEIVGITGLSGCGKSTLLKLLLRFWKKDKGEILYNDIDINSINTNSLKENVIMVSQQTYLFNDTIRNNLKIAKQNASNEEIMEACKKANIHNFIISQKDGYDTIIDMSKIELSAGEVQRLGLARAFLSDAELILLDEPTSNVDSITEGIILKSLQENKRYKTFIMVSHRESTMSIADKVYNMNGGCINV